MNIHLDISCPFNLDATLCCGQAFRWEKHDGWWYGVVRETPFKIRQISNNLEFENADVEFVKNYFGLHDDLAKILSQITKDKHIRKAVEAFKGLRILRQDPWECLISYICATYKNIPAIRQMLERLSAKFGEKISFDDYDSYAFPTMEKLAKATVGDLAKCGLGYRAKYVHETARTLCGSGFDFEQLKNAEYEKTREELLGFSGVGLKVADCVLLFSLGKLEAFPVDVWMKRVILRHYANHFPSEFTEKASSRRSLTSSEYKKLSLFGRSYFGEYAGYAQEYLYHYERTQAHSFCK
ncbi:MAG TPA: DNA glycosylase [Candidatus Bathyarchaeia archaeon]